MGSRSTASTTVCTCKCYDDTSGNYVQHDFNSPTSAEAHDPTKSYINDQTPSSALNADQRANPTTPSKYTAYHRDTIIKHGEDGETPHLARTTGSDGVTTAFAQSNEAALNRHSAADQDYNANTALQKNQGPNSRR